MHAIDKCGHPLPLHVEHVEPDLILLGKFKHNNGSRVEWIRIVLMQLICRGNLNSWIFGGCRYIDCKHMQIVKIPGEVLAAITDLSLFEIEYRVDAPSLQFDVQIIQKYI